MPNLINEEKELIDGRIKNIQYFSDGSKIEITEYNGVITTKKEIQPCGAYCIYDANNIKIEELTPEEVLIKYNPTTQNKYEERHSDGRVITFHENGNISSIKTKDSYTSYYENGNLAFKQQKNYELRLDASGGKLYEYKDGSLYVNPDFFSYYRLGIKSKDTPTHWQEKVQLNPKKKTLICLGGDQTRDAKAANGNINAFAHVLGFSQEQLDNMQLCSCYRPVNLSLNSLFRELGIASKQINDDYRREILSKFMPFMAQIKDNQFVRYSGEELADNFRNIIIQAHCAGANDLVKFAEVFNQTMTELGYTDKEKQKALQQIICITNNSQREFTDNLGFTSIHRYSVKDGQFEPEYDGNFSDAYPIFLSNHPDFCKREGNKSSFIKLKSNEMLMVFDKVLSDESKKSEHNDGFWTTKKDNLTVVGKQQAELMIQIGQFWYTNTGDISDIEDIIIASSKGKETEKFVTKSLEFGRKIKSEQRNPLKNHHILKKVKNEFNDPNHVPEEIGIFKVLSKTKTR